MSQDVKEDLGEISQNSTMDLIEKKLSNLLKESLHGDLLTQQKLDHAAQPLPTNHFDNDPGFRLPPKLDAASQIVAEFLLEKEPEFFRVTEFRNRGWMDNKAEGDAFFKRQRDNADNADDDSRRRFYDMMIQLGMEMHRDTGALIVKPGGKILDICIAPGGMCEAALRVNKNVQAFGISLPPEQGGHPLYIEKSRLSGLHLLDVTLIYKEFADKPIPETHPSPKSFIPIRPFKFHKFDLVFCDGKVLRTHERATYRQQTEVLRLATSQLILAMQRIISGGTIIMLNHKIDGWFSLELLSIFSKFSNVSVFKPARKHATRSSFYMIAKDIQIEHQDAKEALKNWREVWWETTFGGWGNTGERAAPDESYVRKVLAEYGNKLAELGRPVWKIQANALGQTAYAGICPKKWVGKEMSSMANVDGGSTSGKLENLEKEET